MAESSETDSEEETTRLSTKGVDNFSDLLINKKEFNIFEYLYSPEPGSVTVSDSAFEDDTRLTTVKMDSNMNMNNQNHSMPPLLHSIVGMQQNIRQPPMFRPQVRPPPYEQAVRLPDSPPETDSGAGSAGSPSGSETSPYSPEFQHFSHPGHMQGSVIHPPVGAPASHIQQPGVILNVHGLNDNLTQTVLNEYILPVQTNSRVPNNGHINGHMTSDFYPNQPTPGAQQSSPTGTYTPYVLPPPSVHNSFSNDGGSLSRKRPRTENNQFVKPEPTSPPITNGGGYGGSEESLFFEDGSHQTIRFFEFQKEQWHGLYDINGRELPSLGFHVVADKGFNFSHFDGAFVNQKKNHFQISVHIEVRGTFPPKFVRLPGDSPGNLRPISEFQLDFYGVKAEMLSSTVLIKQSQTDRKPVGYEPVKLDLPANRVTKVTVARLHFSETTMNNQRKNGRPNPDQKYFYLVAALNAVVDRSNERYTVVAYSSEKVIVRASNPGQFDNGDNEVHWQKGQNNNSIYHPGQVGIGTDNPKSALHVHGDIQYAGGLIHPSDARLKQNIIDVNTADALTRLSQIRIVRYEIRPEIAEEWGLSESERNRIGVIAQELEEIIPDAVRDDGEYLTVDDNRIFYESAAAVKELCRLTGNLEYKIDEVEKISKKLSKLNRLKRIDSLRSSVASTCSGGKAASICASYLSCSQSTVNATPPTVRRNDKKDSKDPDESEKYLDERQKSRHHHHHHHHHVCRRLRTDGGLCSNKAIQTTIIILVVVMAFCLVAMATLYILDWHKRNTAVSSIANEAYSPSIKPNDRGPTIPSQQIATAKPQEPPGQMKVNVASSATPPRRKVPGIPPPLHPCNKLSCDSFCCSDSTYYFSYGDNGRNGSNGNGQNVIIVAKNLPSPIGGRFRKQRSVDSSNRVVKLGDKYFYHVEQPVEGDEEKNKTTPTSSSGDDTDLLLPGQGSFSAPAKIRILGNINVTLDDRYCMGDYCSDPKRGNFTYFVGVSRYMPHIPLEIQFSVDDNEQVQYCSKDTGQLCFGLDQPHQDVNQNQASDGSYLSSSVQKRHVNVWELPVGSYYQSAFKFRVGTSTTLCNSPNDEAGASFVEYTLWFYRLCI